MPIVVTRELDGDLCTFRGRGEATLVEAVDFIGACIDHCRAHRIRAALVDALDITGAAVPTFVDRFLAIEEWARKADGQVDVALVVVDAYLDPQRFGMRVAEHLGMSAFVSADEAQARAWLDQRHR